MSKPLTSRPSYSKGPFPALIPVGRHAGRPAISLRRPITLVGSRENAHVHLASQSVDPAHALVVVSSGRVYVRDLASHSGVQVNDEPVLEAELGRDDVLKVGTFQFRLSMPGHAPEGREEALPTARFMADGQSVAMDGHVLLIGRRGACDLVVTDPKASRVHAAVVAVNGQYVVRDLGSSAGTLVNVEKVHEQVLESGDEIHVGSHEIYVQIAAPETGVGGADLVDLEDSLAATPQDAEPAVAASIDEPDLLDLDLDLPVVGEEDVADLDAGVTPAAKGDPGPAEETPVAADDEDAPIALDLDLDLGVPEPTTAPPRVNVVEPAEPGPVVAERTEDEAPSAEPVAPEAAAEAAVVDQPVSVEPPADEAGEIGLAAAEPAEVVEGASAPVEIEGDAASDVMVSVETVEEPIGEIADQPHVPVEEEPIAIVAEQVAPEPMEEAAPAVVAQDEGVPVAGEDEASTAAVADEPVPAGVVAEEPPATAAADEDDDLLRLVAEEVGGHAPADSLSGTPFGTALGEVVEGGVDEGPAEEAAESPGDESPFGFGVGANQVMYVTGSAVGWHDATSLAPTSAGSQFEVSLSGVYGTVEGVERLPDPAAEETAETPVHPEPSPSIPVATEEGVASVAIEPPAAPEVRKEQLLGFIRIEEVTPAAPLRQRGPIEPVRNVVEPGEPVSEPAVDLPLDTDAPPDRRPGQRAAAPAPANSPDSLHAVKPPPAAYRITRGLSSLTGGGRAVDVFSQLPVVSEDPVLGRVSGPAQIPPVGDPALAREPASPPPTHEELTDALQPEAEFETPGADRPGDAPPPLIRKLKRLFRERGGKMSVVAAMAAAGAAAYGLTPSTTIVRAEINYRNFTNLPAPLQRATEIRQHQLLADPEILANAVEAITARPDAPGPGFLAGPVVLSTVLDRADANVWPSDRPGTLALSLRSSDPEADAARLHALLDAVINAPANKRFVAAAGESAEKVVRARAELAAMDRNIDRLEHDQQAAQARLASADERAVVASAAVPEPSADERAWRKASLATLKTQADVADLAEEKVAATDPRMKAAESRLAAARVAEAAARDRFVATQRTAVPADDAERHAAETAVSLRTLRSERAAKEAEVKQLQSDADAAAYPELPKNGGVWTNRGPDHRKLYAVIAASVVGVSLSTYLGGRSKRIG